MQRIELNPETVGLIKDRLAKATAGMFMHASAYNQKPLRLKNVFNEFTSTTAKNVEVIIYIDGFTPIKYETPLVQLMIDASTEIDYTYGDVFYFKGKQIYIDHKKVETRIFSFLPKVKKKRFVERISVLKYDHQLSLKEMQQALDHHEETDEAHRAFIEFTVNECISY